MTELINFISICNVVLEKEFNNAIKGERFLLSEVERITRRPTKNKMAQILLSGPEISLTIKLFYDARDFEQCKAYKKKGKTPKYFSDFTKELCNVIGGRIKSHVDKTSLEVELSLPFSATSFDDLFGPTPTHQNVIELKREIRSNACTFLANIILEYKTADTIQQLKECTYTDKEEEIEFF